MIGPVITNQTGILSPYGNFFATEPGAAALVTMPDIDTGERGTGIVHAVSLQLDKNHDGTMDLSFNGADATSANSPMECWVNNGYILPGVNGGLDQDFPLPQNNLNNADYAVGKITCARDLENFFRLWICGVPALAFSNGYSATLTCSTISGSPAINVYLAETNGGIGYLTDTNVAQGLVNEWPIGTAGIGGRTCVLPVNFFDGSTKYLLFEGAGIGEGQFTLTIYQDTNAIAQTSTYIDLHDIEDFYERAVITENTSGSISNWSSSLDPLQPAIANLTGNDTNLMVLVHGINVRPWDCLQQGDTVRKRLYWAGYQGKFATVKWPCDLLTPIPDPLSPANFNDSELQGYKASTAFTNYIGQLRARFSGYRLNILAHSQGNTVVSEAIKKGMAFDTYILTQGALPDSAYDVDAALDTDLTDQEHGEYITPESQPMGYRGIYTNFTGNIVNFYNPQDGVLAIWETDQKSLKPSSYFDLSYYIFDGTDSHFAPYLTDSYLVSDPEESRADVSRSRTLSVGQSGPLSSHGVITSAIDLHAQFNFNNAFDEHSAQWARPIQTSRPYYIQILQSINP